MAPTAPAAGHERALRRRRRLADLFDNGFRIPGTRWRFGLGAVFKAHVRNLKLLEGWLASPTRVRRESTAMLIALPVGAIVMLFGRAAAAVSGFTALVRWLAVM